MSPVEFASGCPRPAPSLSRRRLLGGLAAAAGLLALFPRRALALRGGERRLFLLDTHSGERLEVTYFRDGAYLGDALDRLDGFLRDFRTGERHRMDPALLDLLHELALATSSAAPFQVVSGYRSPQTNAALRARGGGQARHSLHMEGRAIDVRLADVPSEALRDAALALSRGGVGFYRAEDFVHVDTGRVRRW